MKIKKAVIPVAGLGTRFLPATKAQPKEMLPIVDKPCIQYVVEEAINSGIEDIIFVTGRNKRSIEDHFDRSFELEYYLKESHKNEALKQVERISSLAQIHYIRQKTPKGLGHAILCAKSHIGNEPFAVFLGDDLIINKKPCMRQMIDVYQRFKCSILALQKVPMEKISSYGVIAGKEIENKCYMVENLVEKPPQKEAPSDLAIIGRYILTPEIFSILEKTKPGVKGEIQLTDALKTLHGLQMIYGYVFDGIRYDIGDKLGFLKATVELGLIHDDVKSEFKNYLLQILQK